MKSNRAPGITVVVPSYRGIEHVGSCLKSLFSQTVADASVEIVVVLNGPDDGSEAVVREIASANPEVDSQIILAEETGAANARNLGIAAASRQYLTFVDDDDWVSPGYLEALLACAGPDQVALAQLRDVAQDGEISKGGYLRVLAEQGARRDVAVPDLPAALSFNACKAFPAELCEGLEFDPSLRSGEDVVFFTTMYARRPFHLRLTSPRDDAVYFRRVRQGSISRQNLSFDFSVEQRLQVIQRIHDLLPSDDPAVESVIISRMEAQVDFINRYLRTHPEYHRDVVDRLDDLSLEHFPYARMNAGAATTLVVSFCFAPSSDTSAAVMAKRVRTRGQVVDVVSNDMGQVRHEDPSLNLIAAPFVSNHYVLDADPHFSSWAAYEQFRRKGMSSIETHRGGQPYEQIYSRVMWPASNFLAADYKIRHPTTLWIAEFSDPLSRDIEGRERIVPVSISPFLDQVTRTIVAHDLPAPDSSNALYWAEYVALALADTVLFTNQHQLEYMLSYMPAPIRARAEALACISPHPTLPNRFYTNGSNGGDDRSTVDLAYFGSFYKTRGLDDVLTALHQLGDAASSLRLHIFTNTVEEARLSITERGLENLVHVRPYVPYLEFLKLSSQFDCLLVNDAVTADTHDRNPYLPSKWSDYRGTGRPVWGIVEDGSILSRQPLDHRSSIGDVAAAREVLRTLTPR